MNYAKKSWLSSKNVIFKHKEILSQGRKNTFYSYYTLGTALAEVPLGLLNDEEEQNLEMNIDLSKVDRNCTLIIF